MLFNYNEFKDVESSDSIKAQKVATYIQNFGNNAIVDEPFYKEYLQKLEPVKYRVPEELVDDFDWDLLLQLAFGSFSCKTRLRLNNSGLPDLVIEVSSGDNLVEKSIDLLWSYQILRLYEIYFTEQMDLANLRLEEDIEKRAIDSDRKLHLDHFNKQRLQLFSEQKHRQNFVEGVLAINNILSK